jgi:hypothetical protein
VLGEDVGLSFSRLELCLFMSHGVQLAVVAREVVVWAGEASCLEQTVDIVEKGVVEAGSESPRSGI